LFSELRRSERIIIVEDDGVRSVTIGPRQKLRPALRLAASVAALAIAVGGWIWTAAELQRARQQAGYLELAAQSLSEQLADTRSRMSTMGGELDGARQAIAALADGDQALEQRIAGILETLDGAATAEGRTAATQLRTALDAARTELAALSGGDERPGLARAADDALDAVARAGREFARQRAQAALATAQIATDQAERVMDPDRLDPGDAASGFARALAEARAETQRQRALADAAREERDRMARQVAAVEARMAGMTEGQVAVLAQLSGRADLRISELETALADTGLDLEQALAELETTRYGRGGPLLQLASLPVALLPPAASEAMTALEQRLDRQARLRALASLLPLSAPADDFYVSSGFGKRRDPFTNLVASHTGIDLIAPFRSPVMATAPGTVTFSGWEQGYGRMVEVDHGFGVRTRYAHLDRITVKKGETIAHGQQVGTLGNSGRSTGPHLHYEILVGGKPVDPLRFMERGRHVCQG